MQSHDKHTNVNPHNSLKMDAEAKKIKDYNKVLVKFMNFRRPEGTPEYPTGYDFVPEELHEIAPTILFAG